ncbi:hypothetical protein Desaci_2615 [Desulfosporosinus acidiphilus SJ4]|uniref:Uncharacterized protein n=1 Tax=Desulfosporosinus acidiphilus (strain DSM 22704 / JCM 16185 / SJ4) TaxID=646529 RepID=I4D6X4_DESAJ|nr:hypothetical protein Desaci_2615 [Desulfosporosinus acidiphilus SJ4]
MAKKHIRAKKNSPDFSDGKNSTHKNIVVAKKDVVITLL